MNGAEPEAPGQGSEAAVPPGSAAQADSPPVTPEVPGASADAESAATNPPVNAEAMPAIAGAAADPMAAATSIPSESPPIAPPADASPAAAVAPAPSAPSKQPFHFHGRAEEYFRIWIVNTLLTLLTAGLFFPWAKVRKRRYLRGCTELLGHRFDYRANPVRLLYGHLLIAAFFLGYSVFGVVYPVVRYGVLMLGVVMLPWMVARSLAFNAHNTAYRGLRFRFQASLSSAAAVFLLEPLLWVVTLGLYYPAWERSKRRYIVSNHRLGDAYFKFEAGVGPFYLWYFIGGVVLMVALIAAGMFIGFYFSLHRGHPPPLWLTGVFLVMYGFGLFLGRHLIHAELFNHIWNHTRLDDHRFVATMQTGKWLGLQLVNLGAIIGTLGLAYPWSVMRAHRYSASCLGFVLAGPIETIRRLEASGGSATGDTAAEFVGLDFGI